MSITMANRPVSEIALLLAVIFQRSGEKRARISEKTLRLLGRRTKLRSAFIQNLMIELEDYALVLIELDAGGYGLIPSKSLEAAKTITAKSWLHDEEMSAIKRGEAIDINSLLSEIDMSSLVDSDADADAD
jgi:hypothetical protein